MKDIATTYQLYVNDLLAYAFYLGFDKEVAMDAIHDVFLKLSVDIVILSKTNNIKFYLFRALKNKLFDIHKTKKMDIELLTPDINDKIPFEMHVTIDNDLIDVEDQLQIVAQLNEMLDSLTDRQREIIHLRYIQELDYEQIASLMDISVHGCRKLVSQALLNLRKRYGGAMVLLLLRDAYMEALVCA